EAGLVEPLVRLTTSIAVVVGVGVGVGVVVSGVVVRRVVCGGVGGLGGGRVVERPVRRARRQHRQRGGGGKHAADGRPAHQFSPVVVPGSGGVVGSWEVWGAPAAGRARRLPAVQARAPAATARMMITPCTVGRQVEATPRKLSRVKSSSRAKAPAAAESTQP